MLTLAYDSSLECTVYRNASGEVFPLADGNTSDPDITENADLSTTMFAMRSEPTPAQENSQCTGVMFTMRSEPQGTLLA